MTSKKRKHEEQADELQTEDGVSPYLTAFSPDQVKHLLRDICLAVPEAFEILVERANNSIDSRKVFVRGLAWSTTSEQVQELLEKHGEIVESSVVKDNTGLSRGFAFVTFETAAGAIAAVREGEYSLGGRIVHATIAAVKPTEAAPPTQETNRAKHPTPHASTNSTDLRKVFARGLPYTVTVQDVKELFRQFGPIESVELLTDKVSGKFRGSAFILYQSIQYAERAIRSAELEFGGRTIHTHNALDRFSGMQPPPVGIGQGAHGVVPSASNGTGGYTGAGYTGAVMGHPMQGLPVSAPQMMHQQFSNQQQPYVPPVQHPNTSQLLAPSPMVSSSMQAYQAQNSGAVHASHSYPLQAATANSAYSYNAANPRTASRRR